ncbi:hypothetical protein [Priestia aryabhattai]|uniref:hypothetical protein n=1 Tax=Priestia aryabhattai TaxID=412384 RepID=UPI001592D7DE
MNEKKHLLSLDEYIDLIKVPFAITQKKHFERLASKLIFMLKPGYKPTSEYYPAIDGYWKPNDPNEILEFDARMKPAQGWVVFSMKTSSEKRRGMNLLKKSIVEAKEYAKKELKTEDFSWIGVTNLNLSPVQEEEVINYARSQGVFNCGIFQPHLLGTSFVRTIEDADNIAYELGIKVPDHIYKYRDLTPGIAAKEILRELNYLWNNGYDEEYLKRSFLAIHDYFDRRLTKVREFYNEEDGPQKAIYSSMSLDIADDVFTYYLTGEKLCDRETPELKIHTKKEIGSAGNLVGENEKLGHFIIVRDLSVVFSFYQYIFSFFYRRPFSFNREEIVKVKSKSNRVPFSQLFNNFCETKFRNNIYYPLRVNPFIVYHFHKRNKVSILLSLNEEEEVIKI